jgi:hypothetical protein
MPIYENQISLATYEKFGPFKYDENEDPSIKELPYFGFFEFDNGSIYHGQW